MGTHEQEKCTAARVRLDLWWGLQQRIRFDALPYGGEKRSGFGREGVQSAIASMTKEKSIVKRINP